MLKLNKVHLHTCLWVAGPQKWNVEKHLIAVAQKTAKQACAKGLFLIILILQKDHLYYSRWAPQKTFF